MKEKIEITVNGRSYEVDSGVMLLEALQSVGVYVPTLCYHKSLEPSGSCRLCLVEVAHADWKGRTNLVTSCIYPVIAGLEVSTLSRRVRQARGTLLELYLAQCPDSEDIRALARSEGVEGSAYVNKENSNNCVLCGLCTRVCQDLGPSAIASLSRGTDRTVGPRPDYVGEDCTGCRACAYICPTGAIKMEQQDGKLTIWNRTFEVATCEVDAERCRGCGVCEMVCPLDIPRVILSSDGKLASKITAAVCIGCGICAGACPTGAIMQKDITDIRLSGREINGGNLRGKAVVFKCSRSPLPEGMDNVIEVSCAGRIGVEHLLECLARGADGVLVLCRDRATCPTGAGGELGEKCVKVADELAGSAGLGYGRIQYVRPGIGLMGPAESVGAFRASLEPSPLKKVYAGANEGVLGLDRALMIMKWLRGRNELSAEVARSVTPVFAGAESGADTLLYLGDLVDLDLLMSLVSRDKRLTDIFADAVQLLKMKGVAYQPVFTVEQVKESKAGRVLSFCEGDKQDWDRAVEQVSLDEWADGEAGGEISSAHDFRFSISQAQRREFLERLEGLSGALRCNCVHELAQYRLLMSEGVWQEGFFEEPYMAFSNIVRAREKEVSA